MGMKERKAAFVLVSQKCTYYRDASHDCAIVGLVIPPVVPQPHDNRIFSCHQIWQWRPKISGMSGWGNPAWKMISFSAAWIRAPSPSKLW